MGTTETVIAEALHKAHVALLDDLQQLEEAVRPPSKEGLPELRARLGAAHHHVTAHFRFEEHNGYMTAVRKREPRLERTIQQLAEEHGKLRASLEAIVASAQAAARLDDALRAAVQEWIGCMRLHEARENNLVQGVFNLDIGAED
jgi:hypothetical protein